jgi:hypothetical protein
VIWELFRMTNKIGAFRGDVSRVREATATHSTDRTAVQLIRNLSTGMNFIDAARCRTARTGSAGHEMLTICAGSHDAQHWCVRE